MSASVSRPPKEVQGQFAGLRLRVLWTLPQTHQRFLFQEIGRLCRELSPSRPEFTSEISSEELVSEVWAKLIGRHHRAK